MHSRRMLCIRLLSHDRAPRRDSSLYVQPSDEPLHSVLLPSLLLTRCSTVCPGCVILHDSPSVDNRTSIKDHFYGVYVLLYLLQNETVFAVTHNFMVPTARHLTSSMPVDHLYYPLNLS